MRLRAHERDLILGALDSLGVALTDHGHHWTDGEAAIYERAVALLKKDVDTCPVTAVHVGMRKLTISNVAGANWRTTLVGVLLAAALAYRDGAFTDLGNWKLWLMPVGLAVLGYLSKDRNVTGGSVAQDVDGNIDHPKTMMLKMQSKKPH